MNVREPKLAIAGAQAVAWEFGQSTYAPVLADVPPALLSYWSRTAHHEFPGIPRDGSFYAQSAEGLMIFFDCVVAAGRVCALPSRAADSVWHAWAGMDAAGLKRFCIRHFGRPIPHVEKSAMKDNMGRALAATLVQGRRRTGRAVAGTSLPKLFTLDAQLGMPHGFGYRMIGGMVACWALDEFGNPAGDISFPASLRPKALYLCGLVSQAEYEEGVYLERPRDLHPVGADHAGSSTSHSVALDSGSETGDGDSGSDGGGSDGGDGGSGGASCGGGCGGGGGCGS